VRRQEAKRVKTGIKKGLRRVFAVAALIAVVSLAAANTSTTPFDTTKQESVTGTVKSLEWAAPNVWLWVDVTEDSGVTKTWGFRAASREEMTATAGWSKDSFKKGDKVRVEYNPIKTGQRGGLLVRVSRLLEVPADSSPPSD
jgi:hypothetical protein